MGISAKHALTDRELDFCKIWLAFGRKNQNEAYRRAFCVTRDDGEFVDIADWSETPSSEALNKLRPATKDLISGRARTLLGLDYIVKYLGEVEQPVGLTARAVIAEQALFGSESQQARAAEQILKDEDKLGQRDAAVAWAELLLDIGAEIEIPLPYECEHRLVTVCGKCGEREEHEIREPLVARHEIAEMFRKIRKADQPG